MKIPFAALLLLSACAHLPGLWPPEGSPEYPLQCISRCGARLFAPPGVYKETCDDFDAAETRVLDAVEAHEAMACTKLRGVFVAMQPAASWDIGKRHVAGVTRCDRRSIQVGPVPWRQGAFAHECLHIFECPVEDLKHTSWPEWRTAAELAANAPDGVVP